MRKYDDKAYTKMLDNLYRRAIYVKPDELEDFIVEVKRKLPGYPKKNYSLKSPLMERRYRNGMHAPAIIGIAAMCSTTWGTPGYAVSENQAGCITRLVKEGFYYNYDFVSRAR
jgi:hypothetical protein